LSITNIGVPVGSLSKVRQVDCEPRDYGKWPGENASGAITGNDIFGNGRGFLIIDNWREIALHKRVPLADPTRHGTKVVRLNNRNATFARHIMSAANHSDALAGIIRPFPRPHCAPVPQNQHELALIGDAVINSEFHCGLRLFEVIWIDGPKDLHTSSL
jgi:hypothetical protein